MVHQVDWLTVEFVTDEVEKTTAPMRTPPDVVSASGVITGTSPGKLIIHCGASIYHLVQEFIDCTRPFRPWEARRLRLPLLRDADKMREEEVATTASGLSLSSKF